MLEKMETEGPKLEQDAIYSIENYLAATLPRDYKSFLHKHNGGEPVQRAIDFEAEKIHQNGDYVASFYEASNDVSYGILPNLKNHGDQIPENMIYIASSPAGNYFLLSLREDSYGQIFYKDHEFEDKSPFNPFNGVLPESIVKVADNFNEFLFRLYDPDE